ncbi:MAG: BglII/BstYI family type II restriction endonuclease [Bacteroidota bacterium]
MVQISNVYSHKNGEVIFENKEGHLELYKAIETCGYIFQKGAPPRIKKHMVKYLTGKQWADKVRVGNSRLTINFLKQRIGVCFQIGNVARTYADILKLDHLGNQNIIDVGLIIVPDEYESRILGTNYANYERLKNEVILFKNEIQTPLVILGICN